MRSDQTRWSWACNNDHQLYIKLCHWFRFLGIIVFELTILVLIINSTTWHWHLAKFRLHRPVTYLKRNVKNIRGWLKVGESFFKIHSLSILLLFYSDTLELVALWYHRWPLFVPLSLPESICLQDHPLGPSRPYLDSIKDLC